MVRLIQFGLLLLLAFDARGEALPDAATVLRRMQERLEAICADSPTNRFQYLRTNIVEELDSDSKIKKRVEKTYEVVLAQGLPRARLVAIDGKRLPESEQRRRTADEERLRRTLAQDKNPDYDKPKPWISDDLLARFHFTVAARTNVDGRTVLIVTFKAREEAASRNMADRVVNKISGAVWIDEEEAEVVHLNLTMSEPVKFWGGILGQLDRFDWSVQRRRSPLGVWFNHVSTGFIQVRKLFATSRYRTTEEAFQFARDESFNK